MATDEIVPMFLGLPEYIWNSIFQIVEILGVGIILGLFASNYQKRKETEYYLQGEIVKNRIDSYKNIMEAISGIYHSIAPSLEKEALYNELLSGLPFRLSQFSYPSFFSDETQFDDYYKSVSHLCVREHIFLDAMIEYRLHSYLSYLSEIKMMLDAFCDVINQKEGISDDLKKFHIDLAYRCFGLALGNDFGKFYSNIDEQISNRVKHLRLGFRGKRLRLLIVDINNRLSSGLVYLIAGDKKWISKIAYYLFFLLFRNKLDFNLTIYPAYLEVLLMRIYYSDKYSVEELYSMEESERKHMIDLFHHKYISQLHV